MKALVYHNEQGPAMVYLPPASDGVAPEAASIPGGPFPRAVTQVTSRGHDVTWERWCQRLAAQLPYFDHWTISEVPDGTSAEDALSLVREKAAASGV